MRRELWGLRVKTTREPVYTYWASSNRHRALFARREEAEKACLNPMNKDMEPFRITGVDAREMVRHGYWKNVFQDGPCSWSGECSACRVRNDIPHPWVANYCPNCGARMDEEAKDNDA